jgi:anthranilate phosphoribosyltransferase
MQSAMQSDKLAHLLDKLLAGQSLTAAETEAVFAAMLAGELPEPQIAAFLAGWRAKGEQAVELTAGARALRLHAAKVAIPATLRPLIDNCGTGGDGSNSFNISTAAAVVAAAGGARVAKHGNRSSSSKCGSADLLFAAGFPAELPPDGAVALLEKTGMTFFFAPNYHPVMRHVGAVRKALGVRTIFNLLGPLANPIAPDFQLLGVGSAAYVRPVAETLATLGVRRALVVHSRDGLDELSPAAVTDAVSVDGKTLTALPIDPAAIGVRATLADLAGGDPPHNLAILRRVLDGRGGGMTQAVGLNAGAVLWLAERAPSLEAGVKAAFELVAAGAAKDFFNRFIAAAQSLAPAAKRPS